MALNIVYIKFAVLLAKQKFLPPADHTEYMVSAENWVNTVRSS